MCKFFVFISFLLFLASCSTDKDSYYSYLYDPDVEAEEVQMKFSVQEENSTFDYTIRSREMVIDWGDNSRPIEYIYRGDYNQIDSIKALSYRYSGTGEYDIKVKAIHLSVLLLSPNNDNFLSQLSLVRCNRLKRLYCENQPLSELDLSECTDLEILSCGHPDIEMQLSGLSKLVKMEEFYLHGGVFQTELDLIFNTSLTLVSLSNSNCNAVDLSGLDELTYVMMNACIDLEGVKIGDNQRLNKIELRNNSSLDAEALNDIFRSLPQAGDEDIRTITLRSNKGDNTCDRNIAIAKGWVFN